MPNKIYVVLYGENRTLLNNIKEDLNKQKCLAFFWKERLHILMMLFFPNQSIDSVLFMKLVRLIRKFIRKNKSYDTFEEKFLRLVLPDINVYHKHKIAKIMSYLCKDI